MVRTIIAVCDAEDGSAWRSRRLPGYSGANALAIAPSSERSHSANETQDFILPARAKPAPFSRGCSMRRRQKVIPFDELQRHITGKLVAQPKKATAYIAERSYVPPRLGARSGTDLYGFRCGAATVQRTLKTAVPHSTLLRICRSPLRSPVCRKLNGRRHDPAWIRVVRGRRGVTGGASAQGKSFVDCTRPRVCR